MSRYCSKQWLITEALRRWRLRSDGDHTGGQALTTAWTGLGSATTYKPAVDAGLMECATSPNPGYMTWWRLTEAGAKAVQALIDAEGVTS